MITQRVWQNVQKRTLCLNGHCFCTVSHHTVVVETSEAFFLWLRWCTWNDFFPTNFLSSLCFFCRSIYPVLSRIGGSARMIYDRHEKVVLVSNPSSHVPFPISQYTIYILQCIICNYDEEEDVIILPLHSPPL